MKTYYGKNCQQAIDKKAGRADYIPAGIRNCAVKSNTETFIAPELICDGSRIIIGTLTACIVPAFAIVEATKGIAGCIGTEDRLGLFGVFIAKANTPTIVFPAEPNTPLKIAGDVFIKLAGDFPAGGKVSIKFFYTRD